MDNEENNSLRVLQWNINGVRSKLQDLIVLCSQEKIDVMLLQETKITPRCSLRIPGYKLFRSDRTDRGGGVLVGVKNTIPADRLSITDHENTSSETTGNWIESSNLVVLNDGRPTRLACPPVSSSAIGVTVVSARGAMQWNWTVCEDPLGSDHIPIIATYVNTGQNVHNEAEVVHRQSVRDARTDWEKFRQEIRISVRNIVESNVTGSEKLDNLVKALWDAAVSAQKPNSSSRGRTGESRSAVRDKVWFDAECVDLWEERTARFRLFRSSGTRQDFLAYKRADARAKKAFRKKRIDGWRERCEGFSSSTSLGELWSIARSFRGESKKRGGDIDRELLVSFADKLAPIFVSKAFHDEVVDEVQNERWRRFSVQEITIALKEIKNKATGEDNIKASFLKNMPKDAIIVMLDIFNEFMESTDIPTSWQVSKVIAIKKPGKDGNHCDHYRPICLLSIVRKLFEKMLLARLDSWANSRNLIPKSQMGFRSGVGTQNCLAKLHSHIQIAWARKKMLGCVFLDVKSAYDNVLVDILCHDLILNGLPKKIGLLLSRLLSERQLNFYWRNRVSLVRRGFKGLPQGSALSPLCYNLYVRELESVVPESCFILQYADDVVVGTSHTDPNEIKQSLSTACKAIQKFLESKGLALSIQKSAFQLFTRKHNPPNITVEWDNAVVQSLTSFKYLGVVFDSKCLWAAQIRNMVSACSKRINFMRAVAGQTWGAHPTIMRVMYITTIRSVLEYGSIVFRTAARSHMIKLYRIQWQCLRICFGLMKSTHTLTVEVLSGICPLELRFVLLAERFLIRASARQPDLWDDIRYLQQTGGRFSLAEPVLALEEIGWSPTDSREDARVNDLIEHMNVDVSLSIWEQLREFPKELWILVANTFVAEMIRKEQLEVARVIYTDGSKTNDGVGVGMWDTATNTIESLSLNRNATSFTAEMMAIKIALLQTMEIPTEH
uniref:Uncharacterized protein n=1 Tax=Phlebotomus papatasi TaxID=29031 RepID=A0A1B0DFL9_PHLPP